MKNLAILALALPLFACTAEVEATAEPTNAAETAALANMTIEKSNHTVKCGCSIDTIGKCGNYVEIENQFVEIANAADMGLGDMEWCAHGPAMADVAGEVTDGKIVLTSIEITGK
jgi:hypothetical protein